jgi:hypothetical protein
MTNTHNRYNSNNEKKVANPLPPLTLEQILMMQTQMLQIMQQSMANMQQD